MPVPGPDRRLAPPVLSRRHALSVVVLGALAASGCTSDREPDRPDPSGDDPGTGDDPGGEDGQQARDPDLALAAVVLEDEQAALGVVVATAQRHPSLATPLTGLRAAHEAHVSLLREASPESGSPSSAVPTSVPRRPRAALSRLSNLERGLESSTKRHAVAAHSGQLARLVAAMSASAAQNHAVLAQQLSRPEGRR